MILLIDNYDSFSYNLVQLASEIEPDIKVVRNDELSTEDIENLNPSHIIISPGPGRPVDAGICEEAVKRLSGKIPILGVCLGHQAICEAFGGTIVHAKKLMHGKQSVINADNNCPLFKDLPEHPTVARYHSLIADRDTLPEVLKITAEDEDGQIMAVQHRDYPVFGLQFHPESILTKDGYKMMKVFLTEA